MDEVSQFLMSPQRPSGSTMGIVLGLIASLGALALLGYFGWCYYREWRIRKRVQERVKRQCGGNIVPILPVSPDTSWRSEESRTSLAMSEDSPSLMRRRARRAHPWKRSDREAATPH